MKVTESWLREWTNPELSTQEIADFLTMSGLEVDSLEPVAPPFTGIVVGKIVAIEQHPDADKLRVTTVDIGSNDPLQIVCGAPNAALGLIVPTATVGAVLPGDFKIKKAKLRGVPSFGMLCSAKELGISEEADGLLELPTDLVPGTDIRKALQLDDSVIEVDLTPNRGDCLSVRGIARELSVRANSALITPTIEPVAETITDTVDVKLSESTHCPRYVGRVIKNINPSVKSPTWLEQRLTRIGVRSHSLIVDITNYVMFTLGQPMHSFDHAKLTGTIDVRLSNPDESLQLLNEKQVSCHIPTLLISDDNGAIAIAGVMGGSSTEVSDNTVDIFLESAFFSPESIAGKAREYGMHTDASHRFERGVALDTQVDAIELATKLILEYAGGQAGPTSIHEQSDALPKRNTVQLRRFQIERKLGITIDNDRVSAILESLGLICTANTDGWSVQAPAWRFDIEIEEDLIEELGRIVGYDTIPLRSPAIKITRPKITEHAISAREIKQHLVHSGYSEVTAYSFIDQRSNQIFYDYAQQINLANPISSDMSSMRTSILPGLMKTLSYNITRQNLNARFFDVGICFFAAEDNAIPRQPVKLGGLLYGAKSDEQWASTSESVDFYDCKADVNALLSAAGLTDKVQYIADQVTGFHPGQCARIELAGQTIGVIGAVHPLAAKHFQIKSQVFAFELELAPLVSTEPTQYQRLAKFPASRRDIAIIVDTGTNYSDINASISALQQDNLIDIKLFDVYQGESIGENHKSLAIGLTYQSLETTMVDTEIDAAINQIVSMLQKQFNAVLRD
jgi:phenylalanyl-tRNA synthetase beta chain